MPGFDPLQQFQVSTPSPRRPPPSSLQQYQIFDFGARSNPIMLLLDRRDDPVTPLLTQWTYQAMIHELIGMEDNRLTLTCSKVGVEG